MESSTCATNASRYRALALNGSSLLFLFQTHLNMQNITIKKKVSYLGSIDKWCCAIFSSKPHSILSTGHFHKDREKAIAMAEEGFKKSFAFHENLRKQKEGMECTEESMAL